MGSGWERYPGQLDGGVRRRVASGGGGGGGGGGLRGARRDDEVDVSRCDALPSFSVVLCIYSIDRGKDQAPILTGLKPFLQFDTLLKHSAGGAPPPTQILFSYSQPSSPLPPTSKALPPPPPPSKSPLLPSPTPAQLQLPLSPTPSHRPQLPSSPPSMSTSWAHLPPSASLLLPATDDMLTLRSGSTGLLGGSRVGGGEAAHETESVSSWMSAGPAGDGNMEGSDVESVWSMEDASEEEGWSDVGGVGDEKGR